MDRSPSNAAGDKGYKCSVAEAIMDRVRDDRLPRSLNLLTVLLKWFGRYSGRQIIFKGAKRHQEFG